MFYGIAKNVGDSQELRFIVFNDTTVRRYVYLAISEGIKGINGLVTGRTRGEVELNLNLRGGHILHFANLNLTFLYCFCDRLLKRVSRLGERNLTYDEGLVIKFLYLSTYL